MGEHLLSLVNEIETFSTSDAIYDLIPLSGTACELRSISNCWRSLISAAADVKEVIMENYFACAVINGHSLST